MRSASLDAVCRSRRTQGPTLITICAGAPAFPAWSRKRAVTNVSPDGNSMKRVMKPQNCKVLGCLAKPSSPLGNMMHASSRLRATGMSLPLRKRHDRSLTAATTAGVSSKLGGSTAGTPPAIDPDRSQTALLPFPRGRDTSTCKSGNEVALPANAERPTGEPEGPGAPSTTSEKPVPPERW